MPESPLHRHGPVLIDLAISGVFIFAAVGKLMDPTAFADAIRHVGPISGKLPGFSGAGAIAVGLPVFELIWAGLLAIGVRQHLARSVFLMLLLAYTMVLGWLGVTGRAVECGCFGAIASSIPWAIARNVLLIGLLIAALKIRTRFHQYGVLPSDVIFRLIVLILAICAAIGWFTTQQQSSVEPTVVPFALPAANTPTTEQTQASAIVLKAEERYRREYPFLHDWRDQPMCYWVNLPKDFDAKQHYPILLEWPGRGGGSQTRLFLDTYHVTGVIHVGLTYPLGCTGGTPMLYPTEEYVTFIRHVYDDVVEHFQGNPDSVFLGGFSAGGFMTTGPGIALMMRAGLRDSLSGVLAGGCNWMCDPRYAHNVNVLLWYGDQDNNANDLPRRLPDVKHYAKELVVIFKKGYGHSCNPDIEGPAIRQFFHNHAPASP